MKITLATAVAQVALLYTTVSLAQHQGESLHPVYPILHPRGHRLPQQARVFARNVTTNSTVTEAERIVLLAQDEARQRNERLVNNIRKNKYEFRQGPPAPPPPNDDSATGVNATVAEAAALVTELHMMNQTAPGPIEARQASSYWMADMVQNGRSPLVSDPTYKVWRNIKDYGAVGDGVTDDTAAINMAVTDGNRCGVDCGSSTTRFAIVYFPPGTYLVSSSIIQYYMTQFVGHPTNRPVIKASPAFVGLGVLSSNVYIDGADGASWYINQNNFFRQIRNFVVDITEAPLDAYIAGIHWQIAQATSLQNIKFVMSTVPGNNQQGIFMENGSGGMFYDLEFEGGTMGAYVGNQQFTVRNLKFSNHQTRAIEIHWDWGWTWKSVQISDCPVGVLMSTPKSDTEVGSAMFLDSTFTNTPVGFKLQAPTATAKISLSLFNLQTVNVPSIVQYDSGATLLAGSGGATTIASWGLGKRYDTDSGEGSGVWQDGTAYPRTPAISSGLLQGSSFFERSKPQYESLPASSFINVKLAPYNAAGDGSSDDTAKINSALAAAASSGQVLWFPAGIYMVSDTIFAPAGAKVVGQVWSQIMASGSNFQDAQNPRVVVKVGNKGDSGVVEIQDMLFTVKGPNPGAVVLEWNIHESSPGSAAMWDTHIRVGGAAGTNLQTANCPKLTGSVNPNCIAAHTLVHLTSTASAYFENTWFWVADHDLDIPAQTQIDIYVGRGVLVESTRPVWLYGTGSEHCVLYQYQFVDASQVFLGMIQTESPYFQATPNAPAPFTDSLGPYDPDFALCSSNSDKCAVSWAVRIINSQDIYLYGGGMYSWFSKYSQTCLATEDCQQKLVHIESSSNIWLLHVITKAAVEMISPAGGKAVLGLDNKINFCSIVMAWLGSASRVGSGSGGVRHRSPISATVIPFSATTVGPTATFTMGGSPGSVGEAVVDDIDWTPRDGNQNVPPGPGEEFCPRCDLFRLITSTCCGIGGGVANPIEISPGTWIPRDMILPPGYVPNQVIHGDDGVDYNPGVPLPREVVVPKGTWFWFPLTFPAGSPLSDRYTPDTSENELNGTLYITSAIWEGDRTISCHFPCTLVLPPYPTSSTWTPPIITHSVSVPITTVVTVTPTPETTQKIRIQKTTVRNDDSSPTLVIPPIPLPDPPCIKFTIPIIDITITIGFCPPSIQPFPPVPPIPFITLVPVPPGKLPGPVNPRNKPDPDQQQDDEDDEDEDEEEEELTCPFDPSAPNEGDVDGPGSWDPSFGEWPEEHPNYGVTTVRPGAGTGTPGTKTVVHTETVEVTEVVIIETTPTPTPTSTVWVTVTVTPPAPSPTTTNPKPPSPDPSQNKLHCYGGGRLAWKSELWVAINFYCGSGMGRWAGKTIRNNEMLEARAEIDFSLDVVIQFVGKNNCEFTIEENECKRIFGDIERGCGQTQLTYGGWIEGNCYDIRLDPNAS